ncbi:MAG: MgtC/SapB family protein [Dongiaceae bacterium]
MDAFDSLRTVTPELTIALRLGLAALLGAAIGLERELKERPAGLRTHTLTALAAALFTVITFELFHRVQALDESAPADPIRIIEAVTAGVAFLAAGAIIQGRGRVQGLTTGAAIWLAGAIGVACGAGYYSIAVMATLFAIVVLAALHLVDRRGRGAEPAQER